jgi:ankyrin repeat protein
MSNSRSVVKLLENETYYPKLYSTHGVHEHSDNRYRPHALRINYSIYYMTRERDAQSLAKYLDSEKFKIEEILMQNNVGSNAFHYILKGNLFSYSRDFAHAKKDIEKNISTREIELNDMFLPEKNYPRSAIEINIFYNSLFSRPDPALLKNTTEYNEEQKENTRLIIETLFKPFLESKTGELKKLLLAQDHNGSTILHYAALHGTYNCAQCLIDIVVQLSPETRLAIATTANEWGQNIFHLIVQNGLSILQDRIKKFSPDVARIAILQERKDENTGFHALFLSTPRELPEKLDLLINLINDNAIVASNISKQNIQKENILHLMLGRKNITSSDKKEIYHQIKTVFQKNSLDEKKTGPSLYLETLKAKDSKNSTPLYYAVSMREIDIVRDILETKEIPLKDRENLILLENNNKETIIHHALRCSDITMLKFLFSILHSVNAWNFVHQHKKEFYTLIEKNTEIPPLEKNKLDFFIFLDIYDYLCDRSKELLHKKNFIKRRDDFATCIQHLSEEKRMPTTLDISTFKAKKGIFSHTERYWTLRQKLEQCGTSMQAGRFIEFLKSKKECPVARELLKKKSVMPSLTEETEDSYIPSQDTSKNITLKNL